jgi:hypothetical protein
VKSRRRGKSGEEGTVCVEISKRKRKAEQRGGGSALCTESKRQRMYRR